MVSVSVARAQDPSEHVQPTESECRPFIEKALKQLGTAETPPGYVSLPAALEDTGSIEAEIIPSLADSYQQYQMKRLKTLGIILPNTASLAPLIAKHGTRASMQTSSHADNC
ncbi:hypothetical protein PR048_018890 [Dryococelus australis]|uniref:Uncharacterized protein n=1 Tax=Dryococelus australis TaxID=614101 RepID=A0ABQ9H203_9NEOP|nr:hypothetical protein PR048_018890 [Dryococelus australis]